MNDLLLTLIAHMRWADALVADALISTPSPDAEAVRLFAHIASVEHLWYSRIFERAPNHAVWPSLTPLESRALAAEHADCFEAVVRTATDSDLARAVAYTNSAGERYRSTVGEIVTHVTSHGSYHRGQIAARIRTSGGTPPYTDYIQFVRRDQA